MKSLSLAFSLLLLFIISPGCKKTVSEKITDVSNKQMLTGRPWKLVSYGQDGNNNNLIEPSEEAIQNCEKDNIYSFGQDGSGVLTENTDICPGKPAISTFQWSFVNNETGLDFTAGIATITRLTGDSMILRENNSGAGALVLIYIH